jgi:Acyl-CoA synthetases (AMP-forming)/AMP-acid ligases II
MLGYWKRPQETANALVGDGWYKSGDVAWADEEGYLFVVDRAKDMIISGGENIYTTEVENAVFHHPAVLEVAVFGIPHESFGEMVHAEVVTKPGTSITVDEIVAYAESVSADTRCPDRWRSASDPYPNRVPENSEAQSSRSLLARQRTRSELGIRYLAAFGSTLAV